MATPNLYEPEEPLEYIEDHILVQFAPNVTTAVRDRVTHALGGRKYVPLDFLDVGQVVLKEGEDALEAVARFRRDPRVAHAELNYLYRLYAPDEPLERFQWTMDRIRIGEAEEVNQTGGAGAVVAIIDTGVVYGERCADLDQVDFVQGRNMFTGGSNAFGDHYHGTFIATQIAAPINGWRGRGIAPRVSIMPIKGCRWFCDSRGCGGPLCPTDAWAAGIVWATDHGADVINLSLGGPQSTQLGRQAVRYAHDRGVVVVAASGNESSGSRVAPVSYPAAFPEVIAVGATNFNDQRASYSNGGPNLDLVAPAGEHPNRIVPYRGTNVPDAAIGGWFAYDPIRRQYGSCGWIADIGTSFAAPQVAAAAALFKAFGVHDPEDIRTLLVQSARDIGAQGFDTSTGFGVLDILEANRGSGFSFE